MSTRLLWGLGLLMLAVAFVISIIGTGPVRPSTRAKTFATIRNCYWFLGGTVEERSNNLHRLAMLEQKGRDLPSAIAQLYYRPFDESVWTNGFEITNVVLDPWHEPLMVCWRSKISEKASPELLNEHPVLLIWSKGANRSNEWGHGDDVFLPGDDDHFVRIPTR